MGVSVAKEELGRSLSESAVRFERLLPGPIERVWAFLTEGDKLGQWLAFGAVPATVGETFTLKFANGMLTREPVPERYAAHAGEFLGTHRVLAFEPPHRVAFTWDEGENPSEVTFELQKEGDRVRLLLTHRKLDAKGKTDVSGGWHVHLAVLQALLEGSEPPRFWSLLEVVEDIYGRSEAAAG